MTGFFSNLEQSLYRKKKDHNSLTSACQTSVNDRTDSLEAPIKSFSCTVTQALWPFWVSSLITYDLKNILDSLGNGYRPTNSSFV